MKLARLLLVKTNARNLPQAGGYVEQIARR
jgi:hypothetical protein